MNQDLAPASFLRSVPLLDRVPEGQLRDVAQQLTLQRFTPGETLITEGDRDPYWYLIVTGMVAVVTEDLTGSTTTLGTLSSGDTAGEISLVKDVPRTATLQARSEVEVYRLHRDRFRQIESRCPSFADRVRRHADLLLVQSFLRKASLFNHLPADLLQQLAQRLAPRRIPAGQTIVQEGEPGEEFFLVRSGRLEVTRQGRSLAVLEEGDYFGEVALLASIPRTATVTTLEDSDLLALSKHEFQGIVHQDRGLRGQFAQILRIRYQGAPGQNLALPDPVTSMMPFLDADQRQRYWTLLISGGALFALLSLIATFTQVPALGVVALIVGAFLGPVVYVVYLSDAHILPERPATLLITFLLTAGIGLPLAYWLQGNIPYFGTFGSAFTIALIEEPVKILGVLWIMGRRSARFTMDGLVYGAAAGMGFAAFESLFYAFAYSGDLMSALGLTWMRTLLAPLGHGTGSALMGATLWHAKEQAEVHRLLRVGAMFAVVVVLHTLWNWHPLAGSLNILVLLLVGAVGLLILRLVVQQATMETARSVVALNPELAESMTDGRGGDEDRDTANQGGRAGYAYGSSFATPLRCRACQVEMPRGAHYCPRCGLALKQ